MMQTKVLKDVRSSGENLTVFVCEISVCAIQKDCVQEVSPLKLMKALLPSIHNRILCSTGQVVNRVCNMRFL